MSQALLTICIFNNNNNNKNGPEDSGCMTDLIRVFKLSSWNPGVLWSNQGITEGFRWKRQHGVSALLPHDVVALFSCLLHGGDKFLQKKDFGVLRRS